MAPVRRARARAAVLVVAAIGLLGLSACEGRSDSVGVADVVSRPSDHVERLSALSELSYEMAGPDTLRVRFTVAVEVADATSASATSASATSASATELVLKRHTGLYANSSVVAAGSFLLVERGSGWATATVMEDGSLHCVMHNATSGATVEVAHRTRLERDLGGSAALGRKLADNPAVDYYTAPVEVSGALCGEEHDNMNHDDGESESAQEGGNKRRLRSNSNSNEEAAASSVNAQDGGRALAGDSEMVFYGAGACFPGDGALHALSVGLVVDETLLKLYGSRRKAVKEVEAVMTTVSAIYEYQFHVRLSIGALRVAGDANTGHAVFSQCATSTGTSLSKLQSFARTVEDEDAQGAWHLLTNCYPLLPGQSGVVGTANINVAGCKYVNAGWNAGVSTHTGALWKTVAHELGHNLGATHAFGTDGIMDYGHGLIDGKPRFSPEGNSPTSICGLLRTLKDTQCAHFSQVGKPAKLTQTPTDRPTAVPTADPTADNRLTCQGRGRFSCNSGANVCAWDAVAGTCDMMPFVDFGKASACRRGASHGAVKDEWISEGSASDAVACLAKCGAGCLGVEFAEKSGACVLWNQLPNRLHTESGKRCFAKGADVEVAGGFLGRNNNGDGDGDGDDEADEVECDERLDEDVCVGRCRWSALRDVCVAKRFATAPGSCKRNNKAKKSFMLKTLKKTDLQTCMDSCDDDCDAVDFDSKKKMCRRWKLAPTQAQDSAKTKSRTCLVKLLA